MDHEQVFNEIHSLTVLFVVRHKDVLNGLSEVVLTAMKRIMKPFGYLKEVIAAGNYFPLRRDFQFTHQRY